MALCSAARVGGSHAHQDSHPLAPAACPPTIGAPCSPRSALLVFLLKLPLKLAQAVPLKKGLLGLSGRGSGGSGAVAIYSRFIKDSGREDDRHCCRAGNACTSASLRLEGRAFFARRTTVRTRSVDPGRKGGGRLQAARPQAVRHQPRLRTRRRHRREGREEEGMHCVACSVQADWAQVRAVRGLPGRRAGGLPATE